MLNKQIANKFKDYAELAWASYSYFDLLDKKINKEVTKKLNR